MKYLHLSFYFNKLKRRVISMENDVYPAFDFPDDISSLDKAKVERTLDRLWMLAEMSDDYSVTRQEQKKIEMYSKMHNLGENK